MPDLAPLRPLPKTCRSLDVAKLGGVAVDTRTHLPQYASRQDATQTDGSNSACQPLQRHTYARTLLTRCLLSALLNTVLLSSAPRGDGGGAT